MMHETEGGQSALQVARRRGINRDLPGKWKRWLTLAAEGHKLMNALARGFLGQGQPPNGEMARLRCENVALKVGRDLLRRAIAIFAEPAQN
jgi:transposase-like protein